MSISYFSLYFLNIFKIVSFIIQSPPLVYWPLITSRMLDLIFHLFTVSLRISSSYQSASKSYISFLKHTGHALSKIDNRYQYDSRLLCARPHLPTGAKAARQVAKIRRYYFLRARGGFTFTILFIARFLARLSCSSGGRSQHVMLRATIFSASSADFSSFCAYFPHIDDEHIIFIFMTFYAPACHISPRSPASPLPRCFFPGDEPRRSRGALDTC